ncbi:hypothetical protein Q6348_12080 [Isoptericola sp. b441]|uniref:DUF4878 domain-containing protein n=1 Tax=Actinotalea lenta TaxID=3064654 RepID=A0ABT9DCN0_9CELL|nr:MULTISPECIES: hypothetical protein [unclassified Isoptericola]MDO8107933.1 hypothetical protein [Isoptericola sp. b441]MDO8120400.1 hypothetical protein [Isoptericola sp. b490]
MVTRPNRLLAGALVVLLAIVGVATAVALTRGPEKVEAGSPVAVVQDYLTALARGDVTAAAATFDPASGCTVTDVARAYVPDRFRAVLRSRSVDGDGATVQVEITEGADDPFGGGWSHDERFLLIRHAGSWRLTGSPWPLGVCGGRVAP